MLGECSAHKGDVYRNNPTECRASICFSAKNTNKIRSSKQRKSVAGEERGVRGKLVWVLPKTSHQFAAAAKQFTLDIVHFHRSSGKKMRETTTENQTIKKPEIGKRGRVRKGQGARGRGEVKRAGRRKKYVYLNLFCGLVVFVCGSFR